MDQRSSSAPALLQLPVALQFVLCVRAELHITQLFTLLAAHSRTSKYAIATELRTWFWFACPALRVYSKSCDALLFLCMACTGYISHLYCRTEGFRARHCRKGRSPGHKCSGIAEVERNHLGKEHVGLNTFSPWSYERFWHFTRPQKSSRTERNYFKGPQHLSYFFN